MPHQPRAKILPPWSWQGAVAMVLAFGFAASIFTLCLGAVLLNHTFNESEAAILQTTLGAAIGAISAYIGGQLMQGRRAAEDGTIVHDPPATTEPRETDPDAK